MRFGFCADNYNLIKEIKEAGFDYAEISVKDILIPLKEIEIWEQDKLTIKSLNFPLEVANSFLDIEIIGGNINNSLIASYLKNAFQRASSLGVKIIIFGSGASRNIPGYLTRDEALYQLQAFLSKALIYAEESNIIIGLEPLNRKETNFINSICEAGKIIKNINSPHLKLAADYCHMMEENDNIENLYDYKNELVHIHVADNSRQYPGFGDYDFNKLFKVLKEIGYNLRISLECNDFNYNNAKKSLKYLRDYLYQGAK